MKKSIYRQLLLDPWARAISLATPRFIFGEESTGRLSSYPSDDTGSPTLLYDISTQGACRTLRVRPGPPEGQELEEGWEESWSSSSNIKLRPLGSTGAISIDRSDGLVDAPSDLSNALKLALRAAGVPPSRAEFDAGLAASANETLVHIFHYMLESKKYVAQDELAEALADFGDRMQVLCAQHHEICEAVCNYDLSESVDAMLDATEAAIEAAISQLAKRVLPPGGAESSMEAIGWSVQFLRDPRGATVSFSAAGAKELSRAAMYMGQQAFYFPPNRARLADDRALGLVPAKPNWKALSGYEQEPAPPAVKDAKGLGAAKSPAKTKTKPAKAKASDQPTDFTKAIEEDVLAILRLGSLDMSSGQYKLPGQLERKTYERCAAALKLVGGKWKTGKQSFLFDESLEKFSQMLETGRAVDKRDFDFFPTPQWLAQELASWLDLEPGMTVLEPQCGSLALANAAAAIVGKENVICYDILPEFVEKAREAGFVAYQADFLGVDPESGARFDRIIMNPPFASGSDIKHIKHATQFLKTDGLLGAICSPHYKYAQSSLATSFRGMVESASDLVKDVEGGAFAEAGTNITTVMVRLRGDRMPWLAKSDQVDSEPQLEMAFAV